MCAALDEVIEMKKSTLTPSELAVMMVTELRRFRFDLDDILIVQVESEQVGTNWRVLGYDRAGRRMHPECQRRVIEVQDDCVNNTMLSGPTTSIVAAFVEDVIGPSNRAANSSVRNRGVRPCRLALGRRGVTFVASSRHVETKP